MQRINGIINVKTKKKRERVRKDVRDGQNDRCVKGGVRESFLSFIPSFTIFSIIRYFFPSSSLDCIEKLLLIRRRSKLKCK